MQCGRSAGRRYSHRADTPTEKDRDLKFKNTQLKISLKQQWQFQKVFWNYDVYKF